MRFEICDMSRIFSNILHLLIYCFLFILILSLFPMGCSLVDPWSGKGKLIHGIVKDTNGNPVANAYLNFNFIFADGTVDTPVTLEGSQVYITYNVSERNKVKVELRNYLHETVRILHNDTLESGLYQQLLAFKNENGKDLYSDVYFIATIIGSNPVKENKLYRSISQHLSDNPLVFAKTDSNGNFSIPLSRFPYKEIFLRDAGPAYDTLKFSDRQMLTAFTNEKYGRATFSISHLSPMTIILNRTK